MQASDAILRFLDSVGRESDTAFYLNLFRAQAKESFAVLAISGKVVRDAIDALAFDLRFLVQLELYPTVLFGLLTGDDPDAHARATATQLQRHGVRVLHVPAARDTAADEVRTAARNGVLPLVALPRGQDIGARFVRLAGLASSLETRKLIFVRREGRLGRREDRLSIVNLATDYDALANGPLLPREQKDILRHVRRLLLEQINHRMLVAFTSPLNLLKELFTAKGAGTLVRRGAPIRRIGGWDGIDRRRLTELLESSFGRRLRPAFFDRPVDRVFLEDAYRGAAVVRETPLGAFLSKFAVEAQAQGEGIGRDLWQVLSGDYRRLFWRARPDNPIISWYTKQCDGLARFPRWHVFWLGLPPDAIQSALAFALDAPVDFDEP